MRAVHTPKNVVSIGRAPTVYQILVTGTLGQTCYRPGPASATWVKIELIRFCGNQRESLTQSEAQLGLGGPSEVTLEETYREFVGRRNRNARSVKHKQSPGPRSAGSVVCWGAGGRDTGTQDSHDITVGMKQSVDRC